MADESMNREQRRAAARRARRMAAVSSAGVLVASGVALVSGTTPVGAASTFEVKNLLDAGADSLRQAIIDANANGGADIITFQAGLTGIITLASDLPIITDDVDIQGPGAGVITVDGANAYHPFEFEQPGPASISGLTVTKGDSNGANDDDSGGAIALYGGPRNGDAGSLTISNMVLTANHASNDGGAVWCHSRYYEGEHSVGSLTIVGSTISGNTTGGGGGGLYAGDCEGVTVLTSTISGNTADSDGGGLYINYTDTVIRNSTISGNTGDAGGGIIFGDQYSLTSSIQQSTISGNTAREEGGAIYVQSGGVDLTQSTITGNIATTTGGVYSEEAGALGAADDTAGKTPQELATTKSDKVHAQAGYDVNIVGTIIAGNTGFDLTGGGDEDGLINSTNSLLGSVEPATIVHDLGGTLTGANPLLGPLANNGGPTLTHALLAGSPAIDTGPTPVPSYPDNGFDQRGPGFARVINGRVDIGAYEFVQALLVASFTG